MSRRTIIASSIWLVCLMLSGLSSEFETLNLINGIFSVLLLLSSSVACWLSIWGLRRWLAHPLVFMVGCMLLYTAFVLSRPVSVGAPVYPPNGGLIKLIQPMAAMLFGHLAFGGIGIWVAALAWRRYAAWRILAGTTFFLQSLPLILGVWLTPRGAIDAWIDQSSQMIYLFPLLCLSTWMLFAGALVALFELIRGFKREFSGK